MHFSVADLLKWKTMDCGDHWIPRQDPGSPSLGEEHCVARDVMNLKTHRHATFPPKEKPKLIKILDISSTPVDPFYGP